MGLESATYLTGLNATNPIGATDPKSQGDDHLRLIKSVLLNTFPNAGAAINATPAELNYIVGSTGVTGSGKIVRDNAPTFSGLITAQAGIADAYVLSGTSTDVRNNTTYTADSALVTPSLAVGTYWVDIIGNGSFGGGTGGLKVRLGGSATLRATNPDDAGAFLAQVDMVTSVAEADYMAVSNYPSIGGGFDSQSGASTFTFKISARVVITVAGTLRLETAQNTATGNTNFAGRTMVVRRIA